MWENEINKNEYRVLRANLEIGQISFRDGPKVTGGTKMNVMESMNNRVLSVQGYGGKNNSLQKVQGDRINGLLDTRVHDNMMEFILESFTDSTEC